MTALVREELQQKAKSEVCLGLGILQVQLPEVRALRGLLADAALWRAQVSRIQKDPLGPAKAGLCVFGRGDPGPRLSLGAVLGLPPPQEMGGPHSWLPRPALLCVCMSAKMLLIKRISGALLLGPGCSHIP